MKQGKIIIAFLISIGIAACTPVTPISKEEAAKFQGSLRQFIDERFMTLNSERYEFGDVLHFIAFNYDYSENRMPYPEQLMKPFRDLVAFCEARGGKGLRRTRPYPPLEELKDFPNLFNPKKSEAEIVLLLGQMSPWKSTKAAANYFGLGYWKCEGADPEWAVSITPLSLDPIPNWQGSWKVYLRIKAEVD